MLCGRQSSSSLWPTVSYRMAWTPTLGFPDLRTNAPLPFHETSSPALMTINSTRCYNTFPWKQSLSPEFSFGKLLAHQTLFPLLSLSSLLPDHVSVCAQPSKNEVFGKELMYEKMLLVEWSGRALPHLRHPDLLKERKPAWHFSGSHITLLFPMSLLYLQMALSSHASSILYLWCLEFQCNILYTFSFMFASNKFHLFLPETSFRSYSVI